MYSSFDGVYCFRRMTADGQHGCSCKFFFFIQHFILFLFSVASIYGDTGVVHFIDEPSDVDWLVTNGKADPYVPIVPLHHFERNGMLKLKNSKKVSGMLLYNNVSLSAFSPEDSCPNRNSGLRDEACAAGDAWNRNGSALFYEDFGFPMAYVKDLNAIKDIRDVSIHSGNFYVTFLFFPRSVLINSTRILITRLMNGCARFKFSRTCWELSIRQLASVVIQFWII